MSGDVQRIPMSTQQVQEMRRRKARVRLTRGREYVLAHLDDAPMILRDDCTAQEVCDYLRISYSSLMVITRRHRNELIGVGFKPGTRTPAEPSRLSRRAIMHVALLLRPSTSLRANQIAGALGVHRDAKGNSGIKVPTVDKVVRCRGLLDRACALAEMVQQEDPADVWRELGQLTKQELQGVIVALSALLPLDQPGLRGWLAQMGARYDDADDSSAMGLALLIPTELKGVSA